MKGYNLYSYRPYKPLLRSVGDIYICQVAPYANTIHFRWLDSGDAPYSVYCRVMGEGEFILQGSTNGTEFDITGLAEGKDYEFYVCAGEKKSLVRLARTGAIEGTVVNYIHLNDTAYAFSGHYLGSPGILRHPQGHLLASMDVFRGKYPMTLSLIFRSDDDGKTWQYVCDLMPCLCPKLFIHKGELYVLAKSTNSGDLLISKSTDGGNTFCAPVCLLRGGNGKNGTEGVHKNPQPPVYYNGRIYSSLEWGNWSNKVYGHAAMVMSCDENDDLMVPENWSITEPRTFDHFVPELEMLPMDAITIEGTLVIAPNGKLYDVMRFGHYQKALAYEVDPEDHDAPLKYSHLIDFPANQSKFTIKYDEVSGYYYTIGCYYTIDSVLYDPNDGVIREWDFQDMDKHDVRNCQSLLRSKDMANWEVVKHLLDYRDYDPQMVGVQYTDFIMEGDDMLYLTRTAWNGAHSFHDANYSVFHRLKNFRTDPVLE